MVMSERVTFYGYFGNTVTDNLFYHFGVRDAANKVQWFNIYEGTLSLQNYWDWSETKQSADNVHVFESSPAYNFFYKLDDSLAYRIVMRVSIMPSITQGITMQILA